MHKEHFLGCIGSFAAKAALIKDLASYASKAATVNARSTPSTPYQLAKINITFADLSRSVTLHFDTREELIAQMNPWISVIILKS